mmetsp:Transcript_15714/g.40475  ORF Transcript_15714/g.40475 Transcript_15714/m.40475 type:complete len:174 (-) Transcript_15714:226-747(-)
MAPASRRLQDESTDAPQTLPPANVLTDAVPAATTMAPVTMPPLSTLAPVTLPPVAMLPTAAPALDVPATETPAPSGGPLWEMPESHEHGFTLGIALCVLFAVLAAVVLFACRPSKAKKKKQGDASNASRVTRGVHIEPAQPVPAVLSYAAVPAAVAPMATYTHYAPHGHQVHQ